MRQRQGRLSNRGTKSNLMPHNTFPFTIKPRTLIQLQATPYTKHSTDRALTRDICHTFVFCAHYIFRTKTISPIRRFGACLIPYVEVKNDCTVEFLINNYKPSIPCFKSLITCGIYHMPVICTESS
jgi:hypothetical protein